MKLALKLTTVTILNTAVLIMIFGWITATHELGVFDEDMRRDARLLATSLDGLIVEVWSQTGPARVQELIDAVNESESQVRVR